MVKAKAPKKPQIPLGEILSAIDRKDRGFYSQLSTELQKSFSPWMMMRFASSCGNPDYAPYCIMLVNDIVNHHFSDISEKHHKELHWLSFTAASLGSPQTHKFIKPPNTIKKKNKVQEFLLEQYPTMKFDDIKLLVELNSVAELKQFAKDLGYTDKEIKEIFGK